MRLKDKFYYSAKELTGIYSLCAMGMLLALRIVLGIFANSTMALFSYTVKISFNLLPISVAGAMFGPVGAGIIGAAGDILSFFINSAGQPYFPGFTLNGLITGLIFGLFLYKNNSKIKNIIIASVINTIFVEIFLSSIWLYFVYGQGNDSIYIYFLLTRFISETIKAIPITLLIMPVCKVAKRIPAPKNNRQV